MEMVQAKVIAAALLALGACSCTPHMSWTKYDMDGHRTGVTAPNADNVPEALGVLDDSCYVSPDGSVFPAGSATYAAAAELIAVQPEMAPLKQVIGYASHEMLREGPNCALSNWIVDHMMEDVARITGRKVDFTSLPYKKIQAYSVETSGVIDLDSELELWFSSLGRVRFEFTAGADVAEICAVISQYAL